MQQRLRHVTAVMLIQNMGNQVRFEMPALQSLWQLAHQVPPIRRLPVCETIAWVFRTIVTGHFGSS